MSLVTSPSQGPKGPDIEGGGRETGRGWDEGRDRILMSEGQAGTQLESCSLFLKMKHLSLPFRILPWDEASQLRASF